MIIIYPTRMALTSQYSAVTPVALNSRTRMVVSLSKNATKVTVALQTSTEDGIVAYCSAKSVSVMLMYAL